MRDVLTDPNDVAIIKTVVGLAQTLGLDVIAEGVETVDQRNFLNDIGCRRYQGYLFSRPLPLAAFEGAFFGSSGDATATDQRFDSGLAVTNAMTA